jgi:hypothetical protein
MRSVKYGRHIYRFLRGESVVAPHENSCTRREAWKKSGRTACSSGKSLGRRNEMRRHIFMSDDSSGLTTATLVASGAAGEAFMMLELSKDLQQRCMSTNAIMRPAVGNYFRNRKGHR